MRARMKAGCRPIVLGNCSLAPEYPTFWTVAEQDSSAIARLVTAGQVEYEALRTAGGTFAAPGLEQIQHTRHKKPGR